MKNVTNHTCVIGNDFVLLILGIKFIYLQQLYVHVQFNNTKKYNQYIFSSGVITFSVLNNTIYIPV